MWKRIGELTVFILASFLFLGCGSNSEDNKSYIGIMSAMDVELEFLISKLKNEEKVVVAGNTYHKGKLEGKDVVLVESGMGKSLSAAVTAILIDRFNVSSIILTGIAGGVNNDVNITDVVISTKVMFHDYGYYENDKKLVFDKYPLKKVEIEVDKDLVEKAYLSAVDVRGKDNVYKGLIATGDQFLANAEYVDYLSKDLGVLAVDMEGASMGYVASRSSIPFVVIRSMSDKADGLAHEDFQNWYKIVSDNSAKIVLNLLKRL